MKDIRLEITVEETNLILEALGNRPFTRVYELIGKIQAQASEQIQSQNTADTDNDGSKGGE
jgi:hypothetical protein